VKIAEKSGLKARRSWGSDGRAMGYAKGVDVLVDEEIKIQCKKKKKLPQWLVVEEGVDYQVFQTDYKKPMIIIPVEEFFDLITLKNEAGRRYGKI
jgi:hypothetical protein